jgi:hypothetical protein
MRRPCRLTLIYRCRVWTPQRPAFQETCRSWELYESLTWACYRTILPSHQDSRAQLQCNEWPSHVCSSFASDGIDHSLARRRPRRPGAISSPCVRRAAKAGAKSSQTRVRLPKPGQRIAFFRRFVSEEIAMGISQATVSREWTTARRWLRHEMTGTAGT